MHQSNSAVPVWTEQVGVTPTGERLTDTPLRAHWHLSFRYGGQELRQRGETLLYMRNVQGEKRQGTNKSPFFLSHSGIIPRCGNVFLPKGHCMPTPPTFDTTICPMGASATRPSLRLIDDYQHPHPTPTEGDDAMCWHSKTDGRWPLPRRGLPQGQAAEMSDV
jgi:hypothetical protein